MAIEWVNEERSRVAAAMDLYPVSSGRCARLARIVYGVAQPRDATTRGLQILPPTAARFVIPKHDPNPQWISHTLVETMEHRVDALTGTDGTVAANYMAKHWEYCDYLRVQEVDVFSVDPEIEEEP